MRGKSFDATAPERPLETMTREVATDGRRGSIDATARFGATSKTTTGPEPDGAVRASPCVRRRKQRLPAQRFVGCDGGVLGLSDLAPE